MSRDTFAAIILFVIFAAYGQQAMQIDIFPGQELEPFKPRTMPIALAIGGMLLCVVRVFQELRSGATTAVTLSGYDWYRGGALCVVMLAYGFLFTPLGFLLATTLFLTTGFLVLGERRLLALLALPLGFSVLFWAVMTQLLDLYLAPGNWWQLVSG